MPATALSRETIMAAEGAGEQADGPIVLTEGPFAGWSTWSDGADPYESAIGPLCFREEEQGVRCAFIPTRHHLNGGGLIHGGALMSFADFSLFAIARHALKDTKAVTVTFNGEFVAGGAPDIMVEAKGDVLRATRTMVFVRGLVFQQGRTLLAFSGTLKKIG
jgi:acyl-coenzyme A thioesterase PaaI-like protein